MAINSTQSPFIQWELNPDGTRKAVEVLNEQIKIINNQAILNWKPSKYHGVTLDSITVNSSSVDFVEIDLKEEIDAINKFKVNYDNGMIYFHPNLEGYTLNVSRYYDEGQILYHVSRIYYRDTNDVIHTLDEILASITEMTNTLQLVGLNILDTYETKELLDIAHPTGNSGDMYAVGTVDNNVIYVWSVESERWFSIGSLKGVKGDKGDKGDIGATPNITIGTVITGEAGSQASASIAGTTPNLVLNLTIPKGDAGLSGASNWSEIVGKPTTSVTDIDNSATQLAGKSVVTTLGTDDTTVPTSKAVADEIGILNNKLDNGVTLTPTVNLGMNNVIRKTDGVTSLPKFTIKGKSYVNPLGKDGNCEDVSKWGVYNSTLSLDTTKKVFGISAIKITIMSTAGTMYKTLSSYNFDASKYYLISAYVDKGNATNIQLYKDNTGGGLPVLASSTATTPTRIAIKTQPSDNNVGNVLNIVVNGTSGQYAYVDGIMLNEITADEYNNLTVDQLMEKYPYIDSYACLKNPMFKVIHDNLVRNGNCEEGIGYYTKVGTGVLSIYNGKFRIVSTAGGDRFDQIINVKPNTDYYLKCNVSGITGIQIYNTAITTQLRNGIGTFNSGNNSQLVFTMGNATVGTGYVDSIQIIEGTTPPSEYKSYRKEVCVVEGDFATGDDFDYENGKAVGLRNNDHKVLYGKDYDWQYGNDLVGYKNIYISGIQNHIYNSQICTKYDGKILNNANPLITYDQCLLQSGYFYLTVADSDTGWAESIAPNADEVKAFMNGWKTIHVGGSRYLCFWNITTDGSQKSHWANNSCALTTVAYTSGQTTLTVDDGSIFKAGDSFVVIGYTNVLTITSVSGNVLTVPNLGLNVPIGTRVVRCDNGTTDLRNLTYCKNNIAPSYLGYELHYKLATPEKINDVDVRLIGDIVKLD